MKGATELIENYHQEIKDYKHRIQLLEQDEIQRMAKEADYREELANNHGKPLSFFKAPNLATRERSQQQRYRKLKNNQIADKAELERNERAARSTARHSRFALDAEHMELKKLIERREAELNVLLNEYKEDHQNKQSSMSD